MSSCSASRNDRWIRHHTKNIITNNDARTNLITFKQHTVVFRMSIAKSTFVDQAGSCNVNYSSTKSTKTLNLCPGVYSFTVVGGGGGGSYEGASGGAGGLITCTVTFSNDVNLTINVGGGGCYCGGGGLSQVFSVDASGNADGLLNIIAGGGGGGASSATNNYNGGAGGSPMGSPGKGWSDGDGGVGGFNGVGGAGGGGSFDYAGGIGGFYNGNNTGQGGTGQPPLLLGGAGGGAANSNGNTGLPNNSGGSCGSGSGHLYGGYNGGGGSDGVGGGGGAGYGGGGGGAGGNSSDNQGGGGGGGSIVLPNVVAYINNINYSIAANFNYANKSYGAGGNGGGGGSGFVLITSASCNIYNNNVCNPTIGCNVCSACCQTFISNQSDCDGCVSQNCN